MARYELRIPKLGESVIEATLTAWLKEVGEPIAADDGVFEVATDKVDTEIPSEVSGILLEKLFKVEDVIKVGQVVAIIETDSNVDITHEIAPQNEIKEIENNSEEVPFLNPEISVSPTDKIKNTSERYYSPLVKNIAEKENISSSELENIIGTGLQQRITKDDILLYLQNRKNNPNKEHINPEKQNQFISKVDQNSKTGSSKEPLTSVLGNEVIPMDRMGKMVAEHMIRSIQTSVHVQSFIDIDVTKIVHWRTKNKTNFLHKTGENLTYTPLFMQAIAQTISEFPMVNVSVEGTNIIKKKSINIGMATALVDGNLIVPVIKNADELNLLGMVRAVNKLAENARKNALSPDDIQGGTYTVTNVGSFGSTTGTPIINQPQVAILALGAIRKMPTVIETPEEDYIGIRQIMTVSHSYDHRVINGAMGGKFILRLKEILENFDENSNYY